MSGFEPTAPAAPRAARRWSGGSAASRASEVVVRVSGWRRVLATKGTLRFPLASIVRIDHDPLARAHVKIGLRQWRKHGSGVWRLGVYHGLDGWSFWSIGLGRNAVLIECSGAALSLCGHRGGRRRRRRCARSARRGHASTQRIPGGLATAPPPASQAPSRRRARRDRDAPATGQD